jgi:hypothetical protein
LESTVETALARFPWQQARLAAGYPAVFPDLFVAPTNLDDDRRRHSASIAG